MSFIPVPPPSEWRHHPVYIQADEERTTISSSADSLPIGIPIEFESELFVGKILFRFRNIKSDDPQGDAKYFEGRKRLVQSVAQGKFKDRVAMDDVFTGDFYTKPLKNLPPDSICKFIKSFFSFIAPGVVMDLSSDKPKVLSLYAGAVQTFRVDRYGEEPDILTDIDLCEESSLVFPEKIQTAARRRKDLSKPRIASKYYFETDNVYTFHHYDDLIDYENYHVRLGKLGNFDLIKVLDGQPLSFAASTKDGRWLYRFLIHNERQVQPCETC